MKHMYMILAVFAVVAMIAVPVSAQPAGHPQQTSTIQIASGTMVGSSQSIQVSANVNYQGQNVEQYSEAAMSKSRKSIQLAANVNWKGKTVQQQATAQMKRSFKSIQGVANVNIA
jgi:hypothetical protein